MAYDGILHIEFRLPILPFCLFWREMLGAATAERRLPFRWETLQVPSFLEIPWYKERNNLGTNCYLLAPWESSLKIKVRVFILSSNSDFFWWLQNGTWIQRQMGPLGHGAKSWHLGSRHIFYLLSNIVSERNLDICLENLSAVVEVTMAEGCLPLRHRCKHFRAKLHIILIAFWVGASIL